MNQIKMANKKQGKVYSISVIGLSGYDTKEKSLYGVGKSCLCNRFVRPQEDEYTPDHTSFFSTSDFVGTVLNNDHFLYWGKVEKMLDDNTAATFRVIEQTELTNDAVFLPLSQGGDLTPYVKRAIATKLSSPGKVAYISRDQVALQNDYEQVLLDKDGKVFIDGFICVYDVSRRFSEKQNLALLQEETLSSLITQIGKTKKPVVVVATKCDKSSEESLQKAHQFVNMKKLQIPLVETSAESNVNIDIGFQALIQLIDSKSRFRAKLISFQEGLQLQNDLLSKLDEKYLSLVKSTATDSSLLVSWADFKKQHQENDIFKEYTAKCGLQKARKVYNLQAKKITQHHEDKKLNEYLNKLPDALDELLPSLYAIESNEWKWENCQQAIKNHILFEKWFQILKEGETWNSPERLFGTSDIRIPFNVLQVERSRACFDRHIKKLRESARKIRMRNEFRKLLELTNAIQPGTNWLDATQLISSEESYRYLEEHDRKMIFETYLRDITLRAKLDFQELLFESASKFSRLSKDARPSNMEMHEIYEYLQDDDRYKRLENVGNARDILLFNHIALMQSPMRCLSGPEKCMDRLMQQVIEMTTRRNIHNPYENEIFRENEDESINILVVGRDGLGEELEEKIKNDSSSFYCIEVIVDGQIYGLSIKVFESESENYDEELSQVITDFRPQGYLGIYSQKQSFEYVSNCIRKINEYENVSHLSLPLVIMLANESGRESEIQNLRSLGLNLANQMECLFVDYPYTVSLMDDRIHDSQVHDAMKSIVDTINRRSRPVSTPTGVLEETADIRILLCAMCGDEYPVELILSTMLQHHVCYSQQDQQDTIVLEAICGGSRKTISVTLGSYHRAYGLKNQLYHGCILIYSATRLASLETLRAFASTLHQDLPVQVLAVTGSSSGASIIFHEENAMFLLNDGTNLAGKLRAKLQQSLQNQAGQFLTFFNTVYDRKLDTELLSQGLKRRQKEPLPNIPQEWRPNDLIANGDSQLLEATYASIGPKGGAIPPDSPYVEVALRHSYINTHLDSDSAPSSPDRHNSLLIQERSRSSTVNSHEDMIVEHDPSGLYAKVNKHSYSYIKKMEKPYSDEEDDDDLVWQENLAYDSSQNVFAHRVSMASNLDSPKMSDRPYATVPFLPKGHKAAFNDYEKYATLPAERTKKTVWSEPMYASIEQVKAEINSGRNQGYEADSMSSVSSRSKESGGSQLDITEPKSAKAGLTSPNSGANLQQLWLQGKQDEGPKTAAPIAKPDDDESEDIKELRQKLSKSFPRKVSLDEKKSPRKKDKSNNKPRSESSLSSNSLDPRSHNIFKKLIHKVSPNPSPGNSDLEQDSTEVPAETPSKKRRTKSFKKKTQSPATPSVVVNDSDSASKDRSNTLPGVESPKHTPKFSSLDNRRHPKSLFKKHSNGLPDVNLQVSTPEPERFQSVTLDRRKTKKPNKPKGAKDDLYLNLAGQPTGTIERKKEKKPKQLSIRFTKPRAGKRSESDMSRQRKDWEMKNKKNAKFKNSNYFGKPLTDICPPNSLCPIFIKSVITHVEDYGMQSEGIYRLSGNKHDIEAIMEKFETNNNISLQELGVSVHAVTGALKQFFKMLPEPLIPYQFGSKINDIMIIMEAAERVKKLKVLVQEIPQPNLEIFRLFMCHLNKITEHKLENKMDVRNLQTVLYPTLLRPNFVSLQNMSQNMNMGLFIQTCIEQSSTIFCDQSVACNERVPPPENEEKVPNDHKEDDDIKPTDNGSGTNCDDTDGVDTQPVSTELSFMESVFTDPGVENIIKLPSSVQNRLSLDAESKVKKRRSFETAIY